MANKSVFYIEDSQRKVLEDYQAKHGLKSPSEALREIIELHTQVEDQYELMSLGNVLEESLSNAKAKLDQAFKDIRETRRYFQGG